MPEAVDITPTPESQSDSDLAFIQVKLEGEVVARRALDQPCITLGRSSRSDIVLDATSGVSRKHAHILIVDGEAVIEDLGSRNGTMVNGRVCKRRTLRSGDRIKIGSYRIRYRQALPQQLAEAAARAEIAELLQLWNEAAVTGEVGVCPRCRGLEPAVASGDQDAVRTDALPSVEPQRDASAERSTTVERGEGSDERRRSGEIPSGVADAGDTIAGTNFPLFF